MKRNEIPEYKAWKKMKERCYNPNVHAFNRYGGRGIKVCEEWRTDFFSFLRDVGNRPSSKHSIDRINNDGDYEPGNVRWGTKQEQANNRITNTRIMLNGQNLTMADWSRITGLSQECIQARRNAGWTPEQILTQPKRNKIK